MIKRELVVDAIELNDVPQIVAVKGRVVKVVEVDDFCNAFLSHEFSGDNLKAMFWAQFWLDWCGG